MVTGKSPDRRRNIAIGSLVTIVGVTIAGSVFLIQNNQYITQLAPRSYSGLFLISLLAGSPIPILTPCVVLTFVLGSILSPVLVGIIAGLGNTLGNILTYFTGRGGIRFFKDINIFQSVADAESSGAERFLRKIGIMRIVTFANRQEITAIFLLSLYPNPFLTPTVISMGATRRNFRKFLFACWAGQTVQAMILAFLGRFGLRYLLRFLGIFNIP